MTKERAFEILDQFQRCDCDCRFDELPITCDECDDVFYTALKALKEPEIIRCKECVHRGNPKKCILAFVAEKQDFPVSFYDNRGDWFCGDGKRKEGEQDG
ncbi:MAG: hypothetical protein IKF39_00130 [Oscillospiraceae bacterium]|nr:hypothetical protein [Oscillospiraceae bacterium]